VLSSKRWTGGEGREFFALTTAEIEEAIRDAREFLATDLPRQKEAEELAKEENDDSILTPSQEIWQVYQTLLQVRQEEHRLGLARLRLETDLKIVIGTAAGLDRVATWKNHTVTRFDEEMFKEAEPDLYKAFRKSSRVRPFRLL